MRITDLASAGYQAAQTAITETAAATAGGILKTPKQNHRLYGFGYNQAKLTQSHKGFLKNTIIPQILKGKTRVVLWGHADRSGSARGNTTLAQKRMEATQKFLLDNLPAQLKKRVTFNMYNKGESAPLQPATPDGSRSPYDRAVRIGVFTQPGFAQARLQGSPRPAQLTEKPPLTRGRSALRKIFAETERLSVMRTGAMAIDHTTKQSIQQSISAKNLMKILGSHMKFTFAKSVQFARQQGLNVSVDQIAKEFQVWRNAVTSRH